MKTADNNNTSEEVKKQINRRSFIAFGSFIALNAVAYGSWKWLRTQPKIDGIERPLRKTLLTNERIFTKAISKNHLAETFPKSQAVKNFRVNGRFGIKTAPETNWALKVKLNDQETKSITLEELKKLPKTEIIFDFKCIEGWSQISHWGGVKFSDFVKHFDLSEQAAMNYVGLSTPDKKYYVGIDTVSAMHPQTLLCYEHNDMPLSNDHGYPLRLIIPVKYGVKNLKRIGNLYFSNTPPPDYWAEEGYDYFAGL